MKHKVTKENAETYYNEAVQLFDGCLRECISLLATEIRQTEKGSEPILSEEASRIIFYLSRHVMVNAAQMIADGDGQKYRELMHDVFYVMSLQLTTPPPEKVGHANNNEKGGEDGNPIH